MLSEREVADLCADLFRVGWDEVDATLRVTHEQATVAVGSTPVAGLTLGELEQRVQLLTSLALLQQTLIERFMQRVLAARMEPHAGE